MKDSRRKFLRNVLATTAAVAVGSSATAANAETDGGLRAHALDLSGTQVTVKRSELGVSHTYVSIKNTLSEHLYVTVSNQTDRRQINPGESLAEAVTNASTVRIFSLDANGVTEKKSHTFTAGSEGEMARTIDIVGDDTGRSAFKIVEDIYTRS